METTQSFWHILLHIDSYLLSFVSTYGSFTYAALFLIIFCETGLVIFPFLPGDSLLFAAGSIAAHGESTLSIQLLFLLLTLASIFGNKVNYLIGRSLGPKVFKTKSAWFFNTAHLEQAHQFYKQHGGKTIIFARFIPIIRTFIPFVAGVAYMNLKQFSFYNIVSALIWIGSLLGAGYWFGNLPLVKENFSLVVYGIIAISILPAIIGVIYRKYAANLR